MRKPLIVLVIAALAIAVGTSVAVLTQQPQPTQPIVAAQVPKVPLAKGCVDCHNDTIATKLSKVITAWKDKVPDLALEIGKKAGGKDLTGKHPDVAAAVAKEELPTFCLTFHGGKAEGARGVIFSRDIHLMEFLLPKKLQIMAESGLCTACHILDLGTGEMKVKTGKE